MECIRLGGIRSYEISIIYTSMLYCPLLFEFITRSGEWNIILHRSRTIDYQ